MKRLFGTDGVRGLAGEFPLDQTTVERIGRALVGSLPPEGRPAGGRPPRVLVGRDTRESGPGIEETLVRGIESGGGRADRGGVLTTPAVACLTRSLGYQAGIVVSASHNPFRDNGIKIFSRDGFKIPDAVEAEIERHVLDGGPWSGAGAAAGVTAPGAGAAAAGAGATSDAGGPADGPLTPPDLRERYLAWLRGSIAAGASFAGRRIVLDCAHGAASVLAPPLFRDLGAEVIALHDAPDGRNINEGCGALHPERLAESVVGHRAWLGLAFDGDADRCLPVDGAGRVLDGDYVLYLAARDLRATGRLKGHTVVGTVMTNLWLERAFSEEGIRILRAPVGDKYVLEEMRRGGFVLGGEPSGHIIFLERATTGDGILTGLLLMDLLQRSELDLAAWAAGVRPCPQILVNVEVRERPPLDEHPSIGAAIRAEERRLSGAGRLLVRYSGTEPKVRIMVEGEPRSAIEEAAARLRQVIEGAIGR
jgi:phosphoglucosamine mutase